MHSDGRTVVHRGDLYARRVIVESPAPVPTISTSPTVVGGEPVPEFTVDGTKYTLAPTGSGEAEIVEIDGGRYYAYVASIDSETFIFRNNEWVRVAKSTSRGPYVYVTPDGRATEIFTEAKRSSVLTAEKTRGISGLIAEISVEVPPPTDFLIVGEHNYIPSGRGDVPVLITVDERIDVLEYSTQYREENTIIYVDSDGFPVGFSEDGGTNNKPYTDKLGPEAEALNKHLHEEQARQQLGVDIYSKEGTQIDWSKTKEAGTYVLPNGVIKVTNPDAPLRSVELNINTDGKQDEVLSRTIVMMGNEQLGSQSVKEVKEGKATIGGKAVFIGEGNVLATKLTAGKELLMYDNKEAMDAKNALGSIFPQADGTIITTNFQSEEQTIIKPNGEQELLIGDYYKDDSDCDGKDSQGGCFLASGGTLVYMEGGTEKRLAIDYDREGIIGADRKLEGADLYDPLTARYVGRQVDTDGDGTLDMQYTLEDDGMRAKIIGSERSVKVVDPEGNGKWVTEDGKTVQQWVDLKPTIDGTDSLLNLVSTADDPGIRNQLRDLIRDFEEGGLTSLSSELKISYQDYSFSYGAAKVGETKYYVAEDGQIYSYDEDFGTFLMVEGRPSEITATEVEIARSNALENRKRLEERLREAKNKLEEESKKSPKINKDGAADSWQSTVLRGAQTTLESVYALTQSVKDYPALSRLFGLPSGDNFLFDADRTFAPLLGSNWFPSAICEAHYDIEPEGFAVIKTVSGTYQAVAGIQMERSATQSPILCHRNPDQEAEEQFICDQGQVCVSEGFCHSDADGDGEADSDEPALGYFYKITWGVTAPRDEAFTPFVNENGVAVSFNVWLDQTPNDQIDAQNNVFMYSRQGDIISPIQLRNGAVDQDVIIHYSPNLYEEACIKWSQKPATVDMLDGSSEGRRSDGFFRDLGESVSIAGQEGGPLAVRNIGGVTGIDDISDVCFQVDVSSIGEVNWQRSGQQAPSVTVQSGDVQRNSGW